MTTAETIRAAVVKLRETETDPRWLRVADWLDAAAEAWPVSEPNYWSTVRAEALGHRQALATARAVLGDEEAT